MEKQAIRVPVTYHESWDDGFGARGWKLDCSIGEPSVIAATAEAGQRIPTSVLVHDILDHHLCGVGIGGHRNEAIALIQLAQRTDSDPIPDFTQIVEEDLMQGHVNGESMWEFLPEELRDTLPATMDGKTVIRELGMIFGQEGLRQTLIGHFQTLGRAAAGEARRHFESLGLSYQRRTAMGFCLQKVLTDADREMCERQITTAHGEFLLTNANCALELREPACFYYGTEVVL